MRFAFSSFAATSTLLLGACASDLVAPAEPLLVPSLAKALPKGQCDLEKPTAWNGRATYSHGGSKVRVTPDNHLRFTNQSMVDEFGVCVDVSGMAGLTVRTSAFRFGGTADAPNPDLEILVRGNTDVIARIDVLRNSDDEVFGFMDYVDDACMNTVTTRKNGQIVRSKTGDGRIRFPLPKTFRVLGWATFPSDYARLTGQDQGGDIWEVTETASNPAACHQPAPLGGMIISWSSGRSPSCPLTGNCANFWPGELEDMS